MWVMWRQSTGNQHILVSQSFDSKNKSTTTDPDQGQLGCTKHWQMFSRNDEESQHGFFQGVKKVGALGRRSAQR